MKPRVLLLANHDPNHMAHGMGLILNNTCRVLSSQTGCDVTYGLLLEDGAEQRNIQTVQQRYLFPESSCAFRYIRKNLGRLEFGRSIANVGLQRTERRFLKHVRQISSQFDVAIWFGFSWNLLATKLPSACACPVVMHANDSIWLSETMRGGRMGRLRRYLAARQERKVLSAGYAGHVYVSGRDTEFLGSMLGSSGAISALPNGVDGEIFRPLEERLRAKTGPLMLLFVGVMNFGPNIQAASFLIREILPLVKAAVEVRIVGKDPGAEIVALSKAFSNVVVTGAVPDVVGEYQNADLFVAPLQQGAGMKNKVLEALSCGLPVLTTEQVGLAFGERPAGLLVADTAAEFAARIEELGTDRTLLRELGERAGHFSGDAFSWETRTKKLISFALQCAAGSARVARHSNTLRRAQVDSTSN